MRPGRKETIAFVVAALHACVRLVPWDATPLGTDIEASWRWILHIAWERPFVWGRELVFTHGPYGFLLAESYHPATFGWKLGLYAAIALVLAGVLWRIVRERVCSTAAVLAWVLLLLELLAFPGGGQNLFLHLDFILVWLAACREEPSESTTRPLDVWLLHGLVACVALGALVKFTFLLGGLVAVGVFACREIASRKRFPRVVATFAASFLGFWLLARQPLSALGPFLSTSIEVAGGYAESMGLPSPPRDIALFAASAVALLALRILSWRKAGLPGSGLFVAALAALLFLDFKAGFVRGDFPHRLPAAAALLFWLAADLVPRRSVPITKSRIATSLGAGVLVLLLVADVLAQDPGSGLARSAAERIRAWPRAVGAAGRVLAGRTGFPERHRASLEALRRDAALTGPSIPVDLYPARTGLVLASDLEFCPRPVFQSYCAFTPRLLKVNADHLAGSAAPSELLFTVVDWIDRRAPAMDDSLSWPIVLARYEVAGTAAEHLVLRRRARPREIAWTPLPGAAGSFGREITLGAPRTGFALWAEIDVHPTSALRALAFLHRPPVLSLTVRLAGGQARSYRLVPGIARAGFLLSPVIEEDRDFARFAAGGRAALPHMEVDAITVGSPESDDLAWAYGREYEIRLSTLRLVP